MGKITFLQTGSQHCLALQSTPKGFMPPLLSDPDPATKAVVSFTFHSGNGLRLTGHWFPAWTKQASSSGAPTGLHRPESP